MQGRSLELQGSAMVATNGATTVTGFNDGGCFSVITRTALGTYTLALSPQQDAFQSICLLNIRDGIAGANVQYTWTTPDALITVTGFNAAAGAADQAFNIILLRVRPAPV